MTEAELLERMSQYKFYHSVPLTETISTPGDVRHVKSQAPVLETLNKLDLQGKRVLDIGCRDGLFSFTAERLGASEIVAIDNDLSLAAVEFLIPVLDSKVQMREMNLLDLDPDQFGQFDVILLLGVLYHLRYPYHALGNVREMLKPGGTLVLETAIFYGYDEHAMLYCPVGQESPYGPTSCTFFNLKGLTDTLESLGFRVRSTSTLHPDAAEQNEFCRDPVIDRAVVVCERVERDSSDKVEQYWHGNHTVHSGSQ